MIAITHPGKLGDSLYSLPLARLMYGITGEKIDFYTSDYCAPMENLVRYQSYIHDFIIPTDYVIERMDMGCQPYTMPVKEGYSHVIHCGFRSVPDRAIPLFIAHQAGVDAPLVVKYEYPEYTARDTYICIAPRGETSYKQLFNDIADTTHAYIIGGKGDYTGHGIDMTGLDMLDTVSILSHACGFVGLMSAMLVLANGFSMPKIAPHDGKSWDMRHVIYSDTNYYPVNPTTEEVLSLLGLDNNERV